MSGENETYFQQHYGKAVPRMTHDRAIALLERAASSLMHAQDAIGRFGPSETNPLYAAMTDLRRDIFAYLARVPPFTDDDAHHAITGE